jgi:predicted Zn-dependent protease
MDLLEGMARVLEDLQVDGVRPDSWRLFGMRARMTSLGVKDNEAGNPYVPLTHHLGESLQFQITWSDGLVCRGAVDRGGAEDPVQVLESSRQTAYRDPDGSEAGGPARFPEVPLHHPETARTLTGHPKLIQRLLDQVRDEVARHRFGIYSGTLHAAERHAEVRSSAGLQATVQGTTCGYHVHFDGEFGDSLTRRRPPNAEETASRLATAADLAVRLGRAEEPVASGLCPVIFHPVLVEMLLQTFLFGNLSGHAVYHGQSAFRREQFDEREQPFRQDLRVGVDPTRPWAAGSYRFTAEGIPAAPTDFIRQGALVTPILDRKYARRFGRPPTALPGSGDTLILEGPPRITFTEALRTAGAGLFALGLLGLHTQDPSRGEFSLSAPQGLSIRGGELAGRSRVVLSADLLGLLATDDLHLVEFPGFEVPGLLMPCRVHPLEGGQA